MAVGLLNQWVKHPIYLGKSLIQQGDQAVAQRHTGGQCPLIQTALHFQKLAKFVLRGVRL